MCACHVHGERAGACLLLHASTPSAHVRSNCESPAYPHFPNQVPPRLQQLRFPDERVPHLGHAEAAVVAGVIGGSVVTARVCTRVKDAKREILQTHHAHTHIQTMQSVELTFAGLDALDPRVIKLGVASIPTVVEPSTCRSATAAFAGHLESATLGASSRCRSIGQSGRKDDREQEERFTFQHVGSTRMARTRQKNTGNMLLREHVGSNIHSNGIITRRWNMKKCKFSFPIVFGFVKALGQISKAQRGSRFMWSRCMRTSWISTHLHCRNSKNDFNF